MRVHSATFIPRLNPGIRLRQRRSIQCMGDNGEWNTPNAHAERSTDRRRVEITLPKLKYLDKKA